MEHFWDTWETIPKGMGFSHFDSFHLSWLGLFAMILVGNCLLYRKLGQNGRKRWRKIVALLLAADELFMLIPMLITGRFHVSYLPFHLCSINIWLIVIHAWKPGKLLDNFLYTVGIPGALAALLFPSWTRYPIANYMLWHSFTVHILLIVYPVVLTVAGEIRPEPKMIPKTLGLLLAFGAAAMAVNRIFDTNFMFLRYASKSNPLYWFETTMGNHLWGFLVLGAAVIFVMYVPLVFIRRRKEKR